MKRKTNDPGEPLYSANEPLSGSPFILTVKTHQYDTADSMLFSRLGELMGDGFEDAFEEDLGAREADNTLELVTEAVATMKDGRFEIMYDETELTGLEGSRTSLSFMQDEPGLVSVVRSGAIKTVLILECGVRHICTYETPIMPFEICTFAKKIDNSLSFSGGSLILDYIVEIRGAFAQRTVLEITATPSGEAAPESGE